MNKIPQPLKLHPSSVASIMGMSQFKTRNDYLQELLGLKRPKFSLEQKKRMWWGKELEESIIAYLREWDKYTIGGFPEECREVSLWKSYKNSNGYSYEISGRLDAILVDKETGEEILTEIKTTTDASIMIPKASHKIQLNLYLKMYKEIYNIDLKGMLVYFHPNYKITKFLMDFDKTLDQTIFYNIDTFVSDAYENNVDEVCSDTYKDVLDADEQELFNKFIKLHKEINNIPPKLKKEYENIKKFIKENYNGRIRVGDYNIVIANSSRESVDKDKIKEYGLTDFIKKTEFKTIKITNKWKQTLQ